MGLLGLIISSKLLLSILMAVVDCVRGGNGGGGERKATNQSKPGTPWQLDARTVCMQAAADASRSWWTQCSTDSQINVTCLYFI